MLRLVGVTVRRDGQALLDGVRLGVRPGELLLVEGRRGAGKSTLLRVAATLAAPDDGQVWIGGRDVTALQGSSLPYVRRNIGYLPPDAALLPRTTAVENIMLALAMRGVRPGQARAEAVAILADLGASELGGRRTEMLSAGERRLVAVARALVGRPPLLILDEPTSGLHHQDAAAVLGAMLVAVENGAALLCASADLLLAHAVAQVGGRRVTLQNGHLDDALVPRRQPQLPAGGVAAAAGLGDGVPVCSLDYAPTLMVGAGGRAGSSLEIDVAEAAEEEPPLGAGEPAGPEAVDELAATPAPIPARQEAAGSESLPIELDELDELEATPAPVQLRPKATWSESLLSELDETKVRPAPIPMWQEAARSESLPIELDETKVRPAPIPMWQEAARSESLPIELDETKVRPAPIPVWQEAARSESLPIELDELEPTPAPIPARQEAARSESLPIELEMDMAAAPGEPCEERTAALAARAVR